MRAPGAGPRGRAGGPPPGGLAPAARLPMLAVAMLTLVLGMLAGLARGGLVAPVAPMHLAYHAPMMIGGFFGTVIGLERAVALGQRWGYAAPALAAAGALLLWLGGPAAAAAGLQLAAGLVLLATSQRLHARQPALHSATLVAGAACFPAGALAWLGSGDAFAALGLWIDFLLLTIAAERLELSRFLPPAPRARGVFVALAALCLSGALLWAVAPRPGQAVLGAGALGLAAWLARHDIARRTARSPGLTGYIGRCLLSGYAWLAVGGLLLVAGAAAPDPGRWDAGLHAILLGFVMSMVFGHAPIIFPAVLRVQVPYHPVFYLPLALLHATLAARLAGDLLAAPAVRALGLWGNALALLAFLGCTAWAVLRGRSAPRAPVPRS